MDYKHSEFKWIARKVRSDHIRSITTLASPAFLEIWSSASGWDGWEGEFLSVDRREASHYSSSWCAVKIPAACHLRPEMDDGYNQFLSIHFSNCKLNSKTVLYAACGRASQYLNIVTLTTPFLLREAIV